MKIDTDTEIHSHLKHIELAIEEIELADGCKDFSQDMSEALTEITNAVKNFKSAFAEARAERDNL